MQSIAELKKRVVGPSNLNETFHYFFDLMESKTILSSGSSLTPEQVTSNQELKAMTLSIESILNNFYGQNMTISQPMLTFIPHEHLFHGFCTTKTELLPIPILYFSDIKMGAFSVMGFSKNMESFRFALVEPSILSKKAH